MPVIFCIHIERKESQQRSPASFHARATTGEVWVYHKTAYAITALKIQYCIGPETYYTGWVSETTCRSIGIGMGLESLAASQIMAYVFWPWSVKRHNHDIEHCCFGRTTGWKLRTYPKTPKVNAWSDYRTVQEQFIDYHEELLLDPDQFNRQLIP